ncbi:MAG: hypothetical protein Q8R81_11965 [Novosphingobium sp.]|uniref:hypothetical protein n=1 Tax=Novosphingobium sp. TaxID=1874826 RepID=UPI0027343AA2|nr:hypothetical protein [Novosphingobium sp.]MDP3551096.1 hypothetical protein [Novosphingobium sp.]
MKLYLVEIGGMREGHLFESHEVHAMIAANEAELVRVCAARFGGTMNATHLDGWIEIELADTDKPLLDQDKSLFIAELGRNSSDAMREQHDYHFLTAANWKEAVLAARQIAPGWHVDACVDLDALARREGYALKRDEVGEQPQPRSCSRYVRFLDHRVSA